MDRSLSSLSSAWQRRKLPALATFVSVIAGSFVYLSHSPLLYEVKGRLILEERQVSVSEVGRDLSQLPSSVPGGSNPLATQAELIKSKDILHRALDKVILSGAKSSQGKAVSKNLRKNLKVKIIPATNILELSYQDEDPQLASELLNAISEAMVERNTEDIRQEAKSLRQFLEAEVSQQRIKVAQAELAEAKYRQDSGIVAFQEQTAHLVETINNLEAQEITLQGQLEETTVQAQKLQEITDLSNSQSAYAAGRVGQDTELENLRRRLAELDTQLASSGSRLTENHPEILSLLEEREAIINLYQDKVSRLIVDSQTPDPASVASDALSQNLTLQYIVTETSRLALEDRLRALKAERAQLQNRLDQFPDKQRPLTRLERETEETTEVLKFLQQKLEEARIAEEQLFSNLQIIARSDVPTEPSSPKQKVVLVLATVMGIALSTLMALMLELLDNTLHDSSEVQARLKLPLLGVLPTLPKNALNLRQPQRFLDDIRLVEPYRLLFKTLEHRCQEHFRMVVISSAVAGEGKSSVIAHLATMSAISSRRTLIVDADLRRPTQHDIFGVSSKPGLTDIIDGKINLMEAVQSTGIENLSVLSSGTSSSRPFVIVDSAAMQELLAEASEHYDLVLLDTPPVSSCADAHTLSRHGDGLIMVTRPNITPKETLVRAVWELQSNGAPLLGFVVNGMTAQTEMYYRYPVESYQLLPSSSNLPALEPSSSAASNSK